MAKSDSTPTVVDVAIVGGGVAGAYTAYRLRHGTPKRGGMVARMLERSGKDQLDIRLIELGNRIGGRLWSYKVPKMPDQPVDLGGMGFSRMQQNVYGLCTQELKLKMSPCDFFNQQLLQYSRRKRLSVKKGLTDPDLPYDLYAEEKVNSDGNTPYGSSAEMMIDKLKKAIPDCHDTIDKMVGYVMQGDLSNALSMLNKLRMDLRTACATTESAQGIHLHDVGFWNLMADVLSIEAYHLCNDSSFDPAGNLNWNLYDSFLALINVFSYFMLEYVDEAVKASDTEKSFYPFMRLDNGYDELPKELIGKSLKKKEYQLKTKLYRVSRKEIGGEKLLELEIGSADGSSREILYAHAVVLAMPQRSLSLLDKESVIFEGKTFADDLEAVRPVPVSKVFTIYDKQWWRDIEIETSDGNKEKIGNGFSTTDLPMKACYYISKEKDEYGLLLASYADDRFAQFWDGYLLDAPIVNNEKYKPLQRMVIELQRQLAEMHGLNDIPEPRGVLHVNWTNDPFGGGYHNWNPQVKSWVVMPRIRKPVKDANVFICGEAYSAVQGWVEGALNTAEMVVGVHFGLERPDWVLAEYEFGP